MQDEQAHQPDAPATLPPDQDWLLEVLVRAANLGAEIGVTLMVGGVTIAGTLVGGRTYLDAIADQVRDASSNIPDTTAEMASALKNVGEEIYGRSDREGSDESDDSESAEQHDQPIRFIHLKDVELVHPAGRFPMASGWWRGRLTAVDGFILGTPA